MSIRTVEAGRQSISAVARDVGIGPDLIHPETTLASFRPFWSYRPPWPAQRIDVVDANGVIRGTRYVVINPSPPHMRLLTKSKAIPGTTSFRRAFSL